MRGAASPTSRSSKGADPARAARRHRQPHLRLRRLPRRLPLEQVRRRPAARRGCAQREDLAAPPLAELARLDDAAFRARFAGTPVKRTGPRPLRAQRAGRASAIRATAGSPRRPCACSTIASPLVRGDGGVGRCAAAAAGAHRTRLRPRGARSRRTAMCATSGTGRSTLSLVDERGELAESAA